MTHETQDALAAFVWEPQPAAAQLVQRLVEEGVARNPTLAKLARDLLQETGTRLVDWIDTIYLTGTDPFDEQLQKVGYVADARDADFTYWRQPLGIFPLIATTDDGQPSDDNMPTMVVAIKVDSVDDLAASGWWPEVYLEEGNASGRWRRACMSVENGVGLAAIELHGCHSYNHPADSPKLTTAAGRHLQRFIERPRDLATRDEGFAAAQHLITAAVDELGADWACDLFFEAERRNWMHRNHAGRVQYARQQKLGLGWANHDHHTFRSSRAGYNQLVASLELLGFECRERFYAGEEAGWGAQVLEQPQCGFVVFADVDLSPDEIAGDIAHVPLPPRDELGTLGLWCALHGESFLKAGMHHLECQFDFDAACEQLAAAGVKTMAPFTNFPHLRQAFTEGEVWPIDPKAIDQLLQAGHLTADQAEQFGRNGTIGSHLEILERNDGFKGFNQTGVSDIIGRTDPRKW